MYANEAVTRIASQNYTSQAPRDKPPVLVQADELSEALMRLEHTVESLDDQLSPVKNPDRAKDGATGPGAPIQSFSPLAENLRGMTQRVSMLQLRLATLRDTIEV